MTERDNDSDLVGELTAQVPAALAALFDRHRERLLRLISFRLDPRLRRRVDADDVLQEAFVAASARLEHFDGKIPPFVWARLVVQQTMVDLHRRHLGAQARAANREVGIGKFDGESTCFSLAERIAAQITPPSFAARQEDLQRQLKAAIAELDPIDREVIVLRHDEELSNNEVAAELGIQPKAASIRYVRALKRLKDIADRYSGLM